MMQALRRTYDRIPTWVYRVLVVGFGLILLIFNDEIGKADTELFVLLMIIYFFLLLFIFIAWMYRTLRLRKETIKMEVQHLQSQVNPHFFFNVLNNLYGWVDKDPEVAKDMILNLSDMMRYSIYDGQQEYVTIEQEIEYIDKYITLHKNRYLKNIKITKEIDIADPTLKVLPLLFIILLENAFKHGVETLSKDSFVKVTVSSTTKQLDFTVVNNFDLEAEPDPPGVGLKNLKRRLELVYPKQHNLSIEVVDDIHTAKLSIQLR